MSALLYAAGGVQVSTYAGPVRRDGGPRKRVQVTVAPDGQFIQLTMEQWSYLRAAVLHLGPDCRGEEME